MATKKFTELTELTAPADDDLLAIVDMSVTPPVTKKIERQNLIASLGGGTVVQVVNTQTGAVSTGTGTITVDDSIPENTEGTEYMTRAITPTDATHVLKIDVVFFFANTAGSVTTAALYQDSTVNAIAAGILTPQAANSRHGIVFTHYMVAGTTSSTTFKVRAGSASASTLTFNGSGGGRLLGGVMASSITITEIIP